MNFTLNCAKQKFKNGIIYGFFSGFCVGFFPNKLSIYTEEKKYNSVPIPLITGLIGSSVIAFSPLLIINYLCNGVYFDKFIDKYNVDIKRYHQYDGQNNKYAFPSLLIIKIKKM